MGEELGVMGCRRPGLRVVGFEVPRKDRCVLLYGMVILLRTHSNPTTLRMNSA